LSKEKKKGDSNYTIIKIVAGHEVGERGEEGERGSPWGGQRGKKGKGERAKNF